MRLADCCSPGGRAAPLSRRGLADGRSPCGLVALLLVASLAGCRTSRVGESTMTAMAVPGGSRSMIADLLTRAMLNRGYQVRSVDERGAVFARTVEGAAGAMLSGSEASEPPESRVRFTVAHVKGGAHITAVIQFVTNPGTKYEHASLPNGGEDFRRVQEVLAAIRDRVAKRAAAAPPPAKPEEPKRAAKAKKAEPLPDDKPAARTSGDDDVIEQMRKRALGNK